MQAVRTRDTGPEVAVRRILHSAGYRYRLHKRGLPGTPDIVFSTRRKVVFVHGCFWHGHGCKKGKPPKSGGGYWIDKLRANRQRDRKKIEELEQLGWQVMVVWQCEVADSASLSLKLQNFLDGYPSLRSTSQRE